MISKKGNNTGEDKQFYRHWNITAVVTRTRNSRWFCKQGYFVFSSNHTKTIRIHTGN